MSFAEHLRRQQETPDQGFNCKPFQTPETQPLSSVANLTKLKAKYQNKEVTLQKRDYEMFAEENQDNLFSNTVIAKPQLDDDNLVEFSRLKMEAIDSEIAKPEKALKGWGEWTGFGVKEKVVDHDRERRAVEAKIVG